MQQTLMNMEGARHTKTRDHLERILATSTFTAQTHRFPGT